MPIYEYRCRDCGSTAEEVRPVGTDLSSCPECGATSERRFASTGVGIVGPTTDTRGMYRRFTEAGAEMEHRSERYERDHGTPAPAPSYWQAAKHKAAAMVAAGEVPDAIRKSVQAK